MKQKFLIVLGMLLAVALAQPAAAELCKKCRGKAYILTVGECTSCGGHTGSGAFKLCKKCSAEQGKCEHCLARLDGGGKPPRPKPIDPKKSGTYRFGKWKYSLEIKDPGTRSKGKWGKLHYGDKELPGAEVNDHYRTPWGPIYWVCMPDVPLGEHGWMPSPSREVKRKGKLLLSPEGKSQPVELTAADAGKTVQIVVGTTVVISLEGNITTGYSWHAAEVTGHAVKQLGKASYATRPHRPGLVGVGGMFTFKFAAVKPGKVTVKLIYVRPWERDQPPERQFAVAIEVRGDRDRPSDRRKPEKKPPGVGTTGK